MTRINTNVSSLIAQKTLARSNSQLQTSLDRLSTGLRINSGKDDPAGLIASENLRRDITASEKAISNSERANQLIATADSALGQISGLLNDIRGLVTEAANTGVLSDEQIAANQLQVDSSLEAIDRISQVTTFQGRKLLDGSLDFTTNVTAGGSTLKDLNIQQANLGTAGSLDVAVGITTAATQALLTNSSVNYAAGVKASGTLTFGDVTTPATQAIGSINLANTGGGDFISIAADAGSAVDGAAGNGVNVVFTAGAVGSGTSASYAAGQITVSVEVGVSTVGDVVSQINGSTDFTATPAGVISGDVIAGGDVIAYNNVTAGGANAVVANDVITLASASTGAAFNGTLSFATSSSVAAGGVQVQKNGSNVTVTVNNNSTYSLSSLATAIQSQLTGYTASVTTSGSDGSYNSATDTAPTTAALAGGTDDGGTGLSADVTFKLSGAKGSQVFSFIAGTSIASIVSAVNLSSDSTGVKATNNAGTLELRSQEYGSDQLVDVDVIAEGVGGTFGSSLSGTRATGTDVVATINGTSAQGKGNTLSLNTSTLTLSLTVADGSSTGVNFSITGGGAVFQLGPQVVSSQQARMGIKSVNTAQLGGVSGSLYELRSGGAKDLATDTTGAAAVVDETITKVTSLRGRLGAFQRTTLDTNIASLNDTLSNLSEAESSIRDADFAKESASLTRAQILVQSGTAVLQIANQSPQSVLSLLRG